MNGLLGLNCRVLGVSRDQILSAVRQIGCAWVLVQDDPDLVAPLKAMGVKTIYRQSGDETLSLDPATFVQTRAEKNADYVYCTNELDPTPELLDWTRKAIDYADQRNIKLCLFNFATGRTAAQWDSCRAMALRGVSGGHAIGLHAYLHNAPDQDVQWQALKHSIGGLWLVTEYAFYIDAYHGWRGVLSPAQYGAFFDSKLALFQHEQMPVLVFSGDNWPANTQGKASGFGVLDNAAMVSQIARMNAQFSWSVPVTQPPVIQIPPVLGEGLAATVSATAGLRQHSAPSVTAPTLRTLPYRAALTEYPSTLVQESINPFVYVVDSAGNNGWVSQTYLTPVEQETNVVLIPRVPYSSEFGWESGWTALCGETSLYMLLEYDRLLKNVLLPPEITPLSIALYLGKGAKDFTSLEELEKAGLAYGMDTHVEKHRLEDLLQEIDAGRPVTVLLDYSKLPTRWDQKFAGNHILVVCGYSDQSILCLDPDAASPAGQPIHYPRNDFAAAWGAMGNTALILA